MKRVMWWLNVVACAVVLQLPGGPGSAAEQGGSDSEASRRAAQRTWQDSLAPALPRSPIMSISSADETSWTDTVGCPNLCESGTEEQDGVGNVYLLASARTLTRIEAYLDILVPTRLWFVVFESETKDGLYSKVFEHQVSSNGPGTSWYGSGPVSVALETGKYYWIGVCWEHLVAYYFGGTPPNAVSFGTQVSGGHLMSPPGQTDRGAGGSLTYRQRLTTTAAGCSAPPEPGNPRPGPGATDVAIDTSLSWTLSVPTGCDQFRILASTSGLHGGLNPYSLIELGMKPAQETDIGPIGDILHLDFSPKGILYGAGNDVLKIIDPATGETQSVCGSLRTREGKGLSALCGLAFHPDGTLYVVDASSELERVFYTVDPTTCVAAEVCRIPSSKAPIWGIDFSPEGVLYGAFGDLMKIDLKTCQATQVGPSVPFGTWLVDIDWAPDGFLYGVSYEAKKLYKIDPATGLAVAEYGPYGSELLGVASQCAGTPAPSDSADITCDVYLDTVNPPVRLACRDVRPPAQGDVWTCTPDVLWPGATYYWQVVAKNCGGKTPSRIWSFTTEGHISQDMTASTASGTVK